MHRFLVFTPRGTPRSTLFPYTTALPICVVTRDLVHRIAAELLEEGVGQHERSEEHTSELQSRRDLVCRPLPQKRQGAEPASSPADLRSGIGCRRAMSPSAEASWAAGAQV